MGEVMETPSSGCNALSFVFGLPLAHFNIVQLQGFDVPFTFISPFQNFDYKKHQILSSNVPNKFSSKSYLHVVLVTD